MTRSFRFFALVLLSPSVRAEEFTLRVAATTDLHGNLYPYDYYTAHPAERGLAKIATLIRKARAENPQFLLVDCGDTIQGSPLETVHQLAVRAGKTQDQDPMMLAMNSLGYDAMAVGNHEFNYGLANLNRARSAAKFPWLSANTVLAAGSHEKAFDPYVVKTVNGVKIGVIGITTPGVPSWEEPDHYRGYRFESGVTATERALADLKSKHSPDVVIVIAHSGLGGDSGDLAGENMTRLIAERVPGIDAIVYGHTHLEESGKLINGVLMMQPKNWGISLGVMDFVLWNDNGRWRVKSKSSAVRKVTAEVAADPEILKIAEPCHNAAETYLSSPVADAPVELSGRFARVEDTALIDAIQAVELQYAQADVSFASCFNPRVEVKKGPVTVREVAALYIYDNTLYAIDGTGAMVRAALENAARFYKQCTDSNCSTGPLINPRVVGFNYDMAEGVDYEIDLTKPEGSRIVNLRFRGKPLKDDQPLRIAVNNYRAGGSAGYEMFKGAKVLWRSNDEIRDMIIHYYSEKKTLPSSASGNWRVIPAAALKVLEAEAAAEGRRGENR
jgi:2',3'-cyclic-nucleotide 2'-phosphodiesterase/3'-nucleotidase